MSTRKMRENLTDQLFEWIANEGVTLYPHKRSPHIFDALILRPYPVAFKVVIPSNLPGAPYYRYRRLLTERIELAQQFGRFVPLIAIVPSGANTERIIFVDKVFSVNSLPSIHDFTSLVHLDPITQEILSRGDPGEVEFTSEEEFEKRWTDTLTLQKLIEVDDFPLETIAGKISLEYQQDDDIAVNLHQLSLFEKSASEDTVQEITERNLNRDFKKYRSQRSHILSIIRRMIRDNIESTLEHELGTNHTEIRIPLMLDDLPNEENKRRIPSFQERVWEMKNGKHFVIRNLDVIGAGTILRSFEYGADAWILRALSPLKIDYLILLLGADLDPDPDYTYGGALMHKQLIDVSIVNRFEASGWKVFPWDFNKSNPQFVDFLLHEAGR